VTIIDYILLSVLIVAVLLLVIHVVGRTRRNAYEKARADALFESNLTIEVWLCRCCGFKSMMIDEECHRCGAPRPDEYVSMMIRKKEFAAQPHDTPPIPHT